MFILDWIPGRIGALVRRALFAAPTSPNARAWHAIDDYNSDYRRDRRWNDARHRWDERIVHFDPIEEERRHAQGRLSQCDRSV